MDYVKKFGKAKAIAIAVLLAVSAIAAKAAELLGMIPDLQ